ncbi:YdeI/OmpD-associated family protein [Listeria booriae]|uniref:YdhG-like domain-containing protein n=1 Tax=Listeria booriae TaxID=1552123 RepID=A0A099WFT8_9LIST|nr:DUF1801 domain-containing protein [Listeria booriae]KGL44609.1 hypothetical protein EP57_01235 [Listeria booriae]MBC1210387.1 hypothetical protein [Listeria booriae]MBC1291728.1 hypothetical protein [Listeria booriae]MBC1307824.1 hypothetical protein [Listeria booriae]MBC1317129.1 hypothetical protein [Listeria booriae]
MAEQKTNPKVEEYVNKAKRWQAEYKQLRAYALDCDLSEDIKWKHPCFMYEDNNIVLAHGFKEYCALLFMKGVLMKDPNGILVQQTANVQSARQIRFKNLEEIIEMEDIIKAYIKEAIEVEKSGAQVAFKKEEEFPVPEELDQKFAEMPALKEAFEKLTPGRQRAYLLYFAAPKQSKTRVSRIDKYTDRILDGIGLNDRF